MEALVKDHNNDTFGFYNNDYAEDYHDHYSDTQHTNYTTTPNDQRPPSDTYLQGT